MNLQDRVFIVLMATLFLLVLALEWHKRKVPRHVVPVPAGERLLERSNVPQHRDHSDCVDAVADVIPRPGGEFAE
jgi:hypothetical protein